MFKDTRELAKVTANMVDAVLQRQGARDQRHQDLQQRRQGRAVLPAEAGARSTRRTARRLLVDSGYYKAERLQTSDVDGPLQAWQGPSVQAATCPLCSGAASRTRLEHGGEGDGMTHPRDARHHQDVSRASSALTNVNLTVDAGRDPRDRAARTAPASRR